jgi:hypothetical protein
MMVRGENLKKTLERVEYYRASATESPIEADQLFEAASQTSRKRRRRHSISIVKKYDGKKDDQGVFQGCRIVLEA